MSKFNRKNIESICYVRTQIIRASCKDCICSDKCSIYVDKYGCLPYKNYLGGYNNEETADNKQQ